MLCRLSLQVNLHLDLQVELMQGRSIDNAPWPCEDVGDTLKDDLTSCIDWHWLQVSSLSLSSSTVHI